MANIIGNHIVAKVVLLDFANNVCQKEGWGKSIRWVTKVRELVGSRASQTLYTVPSNSTSPKDS